MPTTEVDLRREARGICVRRNEISEQAYKQVAKHSRDQSRSVASFGFFARVLRESESRVCFSHWQAVSAGFYCGCAHLAHWPLLYTYVYIHVQIVVLSVRMSVKIFIIATVCNCCCCSYICSLSFFVRQLRFNAAIIDVLHTYIRTCTHIFIEVLHAESSD